MTGTSERMKNWYGPDRKKWLPGAEIPSYLTGEHPGDYGFDPLGLADPSGPGNFERYREAEVLHGRWAMLGIVGCLVPELLAKVSGAPLPGEGVWFKAGAALFDGGIDYMGNPGLIHAQSAAAIIFFQVVLMGAIESYRWNMTKEQGLDRTYPGGPFDPMGMAGTGDELALRKVREIKNGRLAMVSIVGYWAQAASTHVGPLENWAAHLANPFGMNVMTDMAMFTTSGSKEDIALFAMTGTSERMKNWYGPDRKKWLPGAEIPSYLTGEHPGDYGFDPLGLADPSGPGNFERYREAEVLHGRWAMLGIVGCLVPELLAKVSGAPLPGEGVWFKAGAALFDGGIDYMGNPGLIHAQSAAAIIFFQVVLMGAIESYRWNMTKEQGLDRTYPGGPFDPMGMAGTGDELALRKVREIKNGRLAMVSIVGYWAQAASTHVGPLENWAAHLANPFGMNVMTDMAMFTVSSAK